MHNATTKNSHRVLILDGDMVPCLTILRSLTSKGIICDIASAISKPISYFSRCYDQHYQYPDPLTAEEAFVEFIVDRLNATHYDLVIPITERSLIPLSQSFKLDPWRQRLAIADQSSLPLVLDKSRTLEIAQHLLIPTPFSHTITSLHELEALIPQLDFPVVLKPGQSIPDAQKRRQLNVSYALDTEELISLAQRDLPYCSLLIQQYVLGEGTGIELLANHGEIVFAFQHQRLHELPLTGGGSCYRKSVPINPVLLDASRKLISAINWHGVAMVEFKWQPDTNQYWLMEINGRFWGSLPLAYASGADFPKMLFDLLVFKKPPQSLEYKKQIHCRKLTADLYWFEQIIRRSDTSGLVNYPSYKRVFKDFLFAFHPTRHFFDIQCWPDPLPGIMDILNFVKTQTLRIYERLRYKVLMRWHSSNFAHKRLLSRLQQANRILFLCYGNINRSVLAQRIAEQTIDSSIQFFSAGFHETDKRPADSTMVKIAATFGIDLSNWQSNTITDEIVEISDLILAMEITHLDRLITKYPMAKDKCFLLGTLLVNSDNGNVEISDPYNQSYIVYENTFNRIRMAIQNIKRNE